MSSELNSLVKLIVSGVEGIEACLEGASLPSLNDTEVPSVIGDPRYIQASSIVLAAASRLIATIQNPSLALMESSTGMYTSAILNMIVEANITEALKEAGPQGLHVRDLGAKVGVEPTKLARCLRYLTARHIFREVSPNVFANNRLSNTLDTGLPYDQLKAHDPHRYDNATGLAPAVGHTTDEGLIGAQRISEALLDPKHPSDVTPLMRGTGFDGDCFQWFEQPGNEKRLHRFGTAMKNSVAMFPPEMVLGAYDWNMLPKGSLVVDVGGGVGSTTMPLAKNFSDLRFIVQDRPPVIADGEKYWKKDFPEALDSKLVQLQGHDFFGPQNIKDAAVFMLRFIAHDWPTDKARSILQNLRESATPTTKLLLIEQILPYTCPKEDELTSTIPGAEMPKPPPVLDGNMGLASSVSYTLDIQMLNLAYGQERTIREWDDLVKSAGWKIESIKRGLPNSIICIPV